MLILVVPLLVVMILAATFKIRERMYAKAQSDRRTLDRVLDISKCSSFEGRAVRLVLGKRNINRLRTSRIVIDWRVREV